jgi:ABC-2 type transport system permease protein
MPDTPSSSGTLASVTPPSSGGLVAVVKREFGRMAGSLFSVLNMLVFPVAAAALLAAVFGNGVVRDLPIALVDNDGSALSRQLDRMIDAAPGVRVAFRETSVEAGRLRVLRGEAYGGVVIPSYFSRDVSAGKAPRVPVFYNAQFVLPATTVRKDVTAAVSSLSALVEAGRRAGSGQSTYGARQTTEPLTIDIHTLFNPALSYVPYLLLGLIPTLLQIFVMIQSVQAFGSELREGTAGEWLEAAGNHTTIAVLGKVLPYAVHFTALGLLMLWMLFGWLQIPVSGHLGIITGATILFVLTYLAMGFAAVAIFGNFRLATSLAAFYSVPALAFSGLTFPTFGMPALGQAWASLLPLTHYLRLLIEQALRGAPADTSSKLLIVLAAFAVVPWMVFGWRMNWLARTPRTWGRL